MRQLLITLDQVHPWVGHLGLRLLLAYEFWESGLAKLNGTNWFGEIQAQFPFPFSRLPVEVSWQLVTWLELAGPVALVLGLGTRIVSVALVGLTLVAWASVHAAHGYNVCDNGFKLPLIYLVMFLPLLFGGPGNVSVDHLVRHRFFAR